jgi:hypothetical protein
MEDYLRSEAGEEGPRFTDYIAIRQRILLLGNDIALKPPCGTRFADASHALKSTQGIIRPKLQISLRQADEHRDLNASVH